MRLKELRLNSFGKFHDKTIKLEEGINLIYGDNEAGKSTIHSFIRGMLFGIEKLRGRAAKDDAYLKYQPWDTPGAYRGSMDVEVEGKTYRILRNFDKNTKSCSIINLETGRELNLQPEEMKELYGGLTEAGYRNTISIEQLKSRTEQELVEEVRNYITNLSLSKSNEVDVTKALNFLQDRRKEIEAQQIGSKLVTLEEEITEGLAYETKIDKLTIQLIDIEDKINVLEKKQKMENDNLQELEGFASMEAYNDYLEQFPAIREKYRSYGESLEQNKILREKQAMLQSQLEGFEVNQEKDVLINAHIVRLDLLKTERYSIESKKNLIAEKSKGIQNEKYRNLWYCLIPSIVSILGTLFFIQKSSLGVGISSVIVLVGGVTYLSLAHRTGLKQSAFDQEYDKQEKVILQLQAQERDIFLQQNVLDEQELKKKHEDALRRQMSLEHLRKQIKDYQEQIVAQRERIAILKKEILDYMNQASGIFDWKNPSIQVINGAMDKPIEKIEIPLEFQGQNLNDSIILTFEEQILQQKQRIARNHETMAKEYESYGILKERLKWELNALEGNEEKLFQNKERHKELMRQKIENEQELAAIKLAFETINNLSVEIHDSFGTELNQLVSRLAGEVTDGKYTHIKIDEKLNIKVGHKDNFILLDRLSAGTMEQLFFTLRIAIANLIYGKGTMPILLDDCFALYDDNRTKLALESLSKDGVGQVLLFTCHNREKAMLDQMKIDYHYIDLSNNNQYINH